MGNPVQSVAAGTAGATPKKRPRMALHAFMANRIALASMLAMLLAAGSLLAGDALSLGEVARWCLLGVAILAISGVMLALMRSVARLVTAPLQRLEMQLANVENTIDGDLPTLPARSPREVESLHLEFRNLVGRLTRSRAEVRRALERSNRLRCELDEILRSRDETVARRTEHLRQRTRELEALNASLERMATEDGLTGLANRRALDQFVNAAWRHSRRHELPIAIVLIDVDHFKQFNDRYGHPMGDACLRRIAALLKRHARRGMDLAARYGGEEFALIVPGARLDMARLIAEDLRQGVQDLDTPHADGIDGRVTISLGVAGTRPRRELTPERMIEGADQALYSAKSGGRNRVVVGRPPNDTVSAVGAA